MENKKALPRSPHIERLGFDLITFLSITHRVSESLTLMTLMILLSFFCLSEIDCIWIKSSVIKVIENKVLFKTTIVSMVIILNYFVITDLRFKILQATDSINKKAMKITAVIATVLICVTSVLTCCMLIL